MTRWAGGCSATPLMWTRTSLGAFPRVCFLSFGGSLSSPTQLPSASLISSVAVLKGYGNSSVRLLQGLERSISSMA
eukprot:CAMPEP_0179303846 /NCGR_PEP_ID=MMETSP0797-20121207/48788_1 /TAXON_ID=47934 /ORGANISM="Dinophysis acuminata, Strain DAEP01" /LENGTH=75 /DNA_ID=CAMNT_0021013415 /DNA_START=6 /DNA_END=230 /DNA_ORIENTATION=-